MIAVLKENRDAPARSARDALAGSAVISLAAIKDRRAVEPLIAELKNAKPDFRRLAAEALGSIQDPRAIAPLAATLNDSEPAVWLTAARALKELKYQPATPQESAALWIAAGNWAEAAKIGGPAVEPLIAVLSGSKREMHAPAAEALGAVKDPRAAAPLIAALDPIDGIPEAARPALLKIGPKAVEPLIAALKDGKIRGIEDVAGLLGEIHDVRAVEPLIAALKQHAWPVSDPAQVALAKLGTAAVDPLLALLEDAHPLVRRDAILALGEIKDVRAVAPLLAALSDKDDRVRCARRGPSSMGSTTRGRLNR